MLGPILFLVLFLLSGFLHGLAGYVFFVLLWGAGGSWILYDALPVIKLPNRQESIDWDRDCEEWERKLVTVGPQSEFPGRYFQMAGGIYTLAFFVVVMINLFLELFSTPPRFLLPYAAVLFAVGVTLCFVPRGWALSSALSLYGKLRRIGREKSCRMSGALFPFLFGGKGGAPQPILLETPEKIYRIYAYGDAAGPRRYLFREGKGCLSIEISPSESQGRNPFPEMERRFEEAVSRRERGVRQRRLLLREKFRPLPPPPPPALGPTGKPREAEDILLFFPSGSICMDLDGKRTLGDGGELFRFTVYSPRRFLLGRLGRYLD